MESKMCIEICGFPASGKSFMIENIKNNKLKKLNTEEMYSYVSNMSRLKRNLLTFIYIMCNPLITSTLLIYGLQLSKKQVYPLKRALLCIKFLMIYDYIYKTEKSTYVVDQGIIQFIWSISSQNDKEGLKSTESLKFLLNILEKKYNFIVVYYKVPVKLAAKRAIDRNSNCVFDNLEEELVNHLYSIHENDFVEILNHLSFKKSYTVNSITDFEKRINSIIY